MRRFKKTFNKIHMFLLATVFSFSILTIGGYGAESLYEPSSVTSLGHETLTSKQLELIKAAESGDLPTVKRLINKEKVNKNTRNIEEDGDSLVHISIKEQRQDVFNFLLKINCDVDIKNYYGETPLHEAASNNYKKMLEDLLEEESSNINTQDKDGNTAFHKAIQKLNFDCIFSFMNTPEKNFDYTIKNSKGMTVLDMINKQIQQSNKENAVRFWEIKDKITRFSNTTVRTILKTEVPLTSPVQNMASLIIKNSKKIFFSYCWDSEYGTKPMVDDFEAFIKKLGIINYYRDVREEEGKGLTPGTHIEDFMKNARDSDVVVIFLNNAYLKSINCMYEFLQVWNESTRKISSKVFVIRHPEFVSIFGGPNSATGYKEHWDSVFKSLRSDKVSAADMEWHHKKEELVGRIFRNITPILQELTSYIQADYQTLRLKSFEDIFKLALGNIEIKTNQTQENIVKETDKSIDDETGKLLTSISVREPIIYDCIDVYKLLAAPVLTYINLYESCKIIYSLYDARQKESKEKGINDSNLVEIYESKLMSEAGREEVLSIGSVIEDPWVNSPISPTNLKYIIAKEFVPIMKKDLSRTMEIYEKVYSHPHIRKAELNY